MWNLQLGSWCCRSWTAPPEVSSLFAVIFQDGFSSQIPTSPFSRCLRQQFRQQAWRGPGNEKEEEKKKTTAQKLSGVFCLIKTRGTKSKMCWYIKVHQCRSQRWELFHSAWEGNSPAVSQNFSRTPRTKCKRYKLYRPAEQRRARTKGPEKVKEKEKKKDFFFRIFFVCLVGW